MGDRYSRILESSRYYAALTNYLQYIQNQDRRHTGVGEGNPRPPSVTLFIEPFDYNLPAGQKHRTSASQIAWNRYKGNSYLAARTTDVTPTGDGEVIKLAKFRPARVIVTTGRSQTGVVKTSRVTKMKYLSYGGDSTSIPFGRANATDTFAEATSIIRGQIQASLGPNDKIAFSNEKVSA